MFEAQQRQCKYNNTSTYPVRRKCHNRAGNHDQTFRVNLTRKTGQTDENSHSNMFLTHFPGLMLTKKLVRSALRTQHLDSGTLECCGVGPDSTQFNTCVLFCLFSASRHTARSGWLASHKALLPDHATLLLKGGCSVCFFYSFKRLNMTF